MRAFLLLPILFSTAASAATFNITPEGEDGGYRLTGPCYLSGQADDCPFDTGAPFSVIALGDTNKGLPSLAHRTISSIGLSMECDLVKVPDFVFFGSPSPGQEFWRCDNLPSVTSLVGMDFFETQPFLLNFNEASIEFGGGHPDNLQDLEQWGPEKKLIMPASLAGESVHMAVDTGSPVTFVDQKVIDGNPMIFVESTRPPSEMMKRRGLRRYEMHGQFVVNGLPLHAEYVYGADVEGFAGFKYSVILGVNHMKGAKWYFDVPGRKWAIYR
jgi:hypothetical protein